ncbi:ABC transporter ATP-binding protein [Patescibacteria group bacterium]|nr:ABC transporter ATP-binding protein [Patescibacteria group bacterium]MBU1931201.1 ABC transporter ATP-binding protein [Patescibacteria group bacterium]
MNNVIEFNQLSKRYFKQNQKTFKELLPALFKGKSGGRFVWALKDIDLKIARGETLGIIGLNGSGKTTLLKLMAGITQPTMGKIMVKGRISPLIELGAGFHPELTGRENIYLNASILGIAKKAIDQNFKQIVSFAEIGEFINTPVKFYSSGMYMRLGFSIAVNVRPEILLVDEILAVGDISFKEKCFKKMNQFKKQHTTIIFISHSMETVVNFCSRVILLEAGKIIADGQPEKVVRKFIKRVANEK